VTRILVLWEHPPALSGAEAEEWAHAEVGRLLEADSIEQASLASLERPSDSAAAHDYNWLLELEVSSDDAVHDRRLTELVRDLRMLGMRPLVVVPDESTRLSLRR
jgi:hypothetical protein